MKYPSSMIEKANWHKDAKYGSTIKRDHDNYMIKILCEEEAVDASLKRQCPYEA